MNIAIVDDLKHEIDVMTDHYCDELYDAGFYMLRFPISRLVCDPERFRDDKDEIMSSVGMGAVYSLCSDGSGLKKVSEKHKEEILKEYYDVYHERFEALTGMYLEKFDKCLIVDGHSFHETPLPYELDKNTDRPDICIGTDDFHTPKNITEGIKDFFLHRGYSVEVNRPFSGSIVPLKYYRREKRVISLMIELNRRLYLDCNYEKNSNFEHLKKDIVSAMDLLKNYL